MRRYLSKFEFTPQLIESAIYDCLNGVGNSNSRWKRMDSAYFLAEYLIYFSRDKDKNKHDLAREIHDYIMKYENYRMKFNPLIKVISRNIHHEIVNHEINLPPIRYQMRRDNCSGKLRKIGLASIKQQVYDHIVVKACMGMFMNKIGQYQCASIRGRGQVYGKETIEKWIRKNPKNCKYVWKGDVKKFYPSIPHDKLKKLLRRDIKNNDVLYVVFHLIDTYGEDFGLCIGSYLSQFLANYYLSYAYHFLSEKCFTTRKKRRTKEVIQVRLISYQLFYMDDIILFSPNKKYLKKCVNMLSKYLNDELGLSIKDGHQLFPLDSRPIDMMGYKIYTYKTTIRKRIFKRTNVILATYKDPKKVMNVETARAFMSYKGYLDHSDSVKYRKKMKFKRTFKNAKEVIRNYAKYSGVHGQTT